METDASTQENVSPENPDVPQGDVLPQEPENPETADAPQGDTLPTEPENPETADAPQGDALSTEQQNRISVQAEGETIYFEEDFDGEGITVGEIIRSGTATAPAPVTVNKMVWSAGNRSGGITCIASIQEADNNKYLDIYEERFATSNRGVSFVFQYDEALPAVDTLKSESKILELSMDVTSTQTFEVTGFGTMPVASGAHVRAIIDAENGKQYVIVTDSNGLVSSSIADLTSAGFTGATFYNEYTEAQIDNIKVASKSADVRLVTVTVKNGELPIEGAEVAIGAVKVQTDASGEAVFALPDGSYSVEASKEGYEVTPGAGDAAAENITVSSTAAAFTLNLDVAGGFTDDIKALAVLPNLGVTQAEFKAGYKHPDKVEATLLTGSKIDVTIKEDTWTSTPDFDEEKEDVYTWTAEIAAPEDHANPNNLTVSYKMLYDVLRKTTEADGTVVENTDFKDVTEKWGMTGKGADCVSIENDTEWVGNKFLQFKSANLNGSTTAIRNFGTLPKMTTAKMEFEWRTGKMSSNGMVGWVGITWMSGENELLSLYYNDANRNFRNDGDKGDLYYSVNGIENRDKTGISITAGSWHDVEITFDFSEHKATLRVGENEAVIEGLLEVAKKVDGFGFITVDNSAGGDAKVTTEVRMDDFFFAYVEDTSISTDKQTVYSVDEIPNRTVTQEEWDAGTYKHPETVSVILSEGDKIDVEIDAASWTCEGFDPNKKAAYLWTADLIVPDEYENPKGLKASYTMEYHAAMTEEHDYYNDFTFSSEVCPSTAWGNLDQMSGTGYLTLSHKTEDNGNGYMFASVTNAGGGRGTRIDFSTNAVKGAEISFDWMPVTAVPAGIGSGNIDFFSASNRQNYFTLRFDSDYKITYFTKGDYNNTTVQPEFDGSISEADRVDTGLSGQNKWFTVKLVFDYYAHTAKLEIAERDDPSKSYTAEVPIEASANGLSTLVMRMDRAENVTCSAEMGVDNIVLDYTPFDADWIVGVKNPANVNVARSLWDQFTFPETVEVTLGDNTKAQVPVGEWTADPAFDLETSPAGEYVWTAQLVPGELKNMFGYSASFTMTYTSYPFPTYVYNPNTLELSFGEELPAEFPKEVNAKMSDGSMGKAAVGEWTAIREFNAGEEGIYVYGANIVPVDGVYDIVRDKLSPNENPGTQREDQDKYVYDVYYRISYTQDADNYNGYVRTMENLDRGVYAVAVDGGVFVSWRLLAEEYGTDKEISFNVYRGSTKVNDAPITNKTNYVDSSGKEGDVYTVVKVKAGVTYEGAKATASGQNYMSIPVQKPEPQPTKDGNLAAYTLNDMGVADVDGDGEYEFIVKWYPDNAFDSGMANGPSSPTIFDLYELDGTPLWRLNLGLEMPSGAHFNQFMLYDLDEDGRAELFIKTSDGTISYKPNAEGRFDMNDDSTIVAYIGDRSVTPGTNIEANGHVNKNSNEYVTVFNGLTGEVIDSIAYENTTGEFTDWGTAGGGKNDGGNRSARYNIAIAYLPKAAGSTETIPAVLLNRGYYAKTTVIAYTLRDGKLQKEWNFVRQTGENEAGKGNHNMSTGDIDKDGFDELIIGALAIDHDGSVLWVKDGKEGQDFSGHADTIHLAAMNPDSNDLYVFTPNEEKELSTMNAALVNARTGARIGGSWFTLKDVGRAIAANITPTPGYEYWSASTGSGMYAFDGSVISNTIPVSMNWRMYWDGDLLSELGDGIATDDDWAVTKYDWVNNKVDTLTVMEGTKTNNSTKKTPCLTADLFGDWREEVVLRNEDDTELRVYMTTEETDYMIYTLMHDPVYRNAVANQNTAYNQPPHIGFYLGEDNKESVLAMGLPVAKIKYGTPREEKAYDYAVETKEVPEPSEELKQKLSEQGIECNTAEELKNYLAADAASEVQNNFNVEIQNIGTVVWEIAVKVKTMQGDKVVAMEDATAENFPVGGIDIVLNYPEGTNGTDYNFVVRHLITMCPEDKIGEIMDEEVTKTERGLELHIMGASPFAIGWYKVGSEATPTPEPEETPEPGQTPKPEETPEPGQTPKPGETPEPGQTQQPEESPKPIPSSQPDEDDGDDEDESIENTSEEQVSAPAKTGDHMGNILVMCIVLIAISGMGIGATMFIRYRRKK